MSQTDEHAVAERIMEAFEGDGWPGVDYIADIIKNGRCKILKCKTEGMTLKERLRDAEAKARAEAKGFCKERGKHRWRPPFGKRVSGGGELITGFCGGPDIPDPEYTETWSYFQRECVDCGKVQTSDVEGLDWKAEAGLGKIMCDENTGRRYWWDEKKQKSEWIDHLC